MSKLTQYGHAFQIKALAILITDRDFLQQIADIVSPDYFDNDAGKWIIRNTLKYYNEYKTCPTMEVFKVEVEGINQELQSVAVKDLLKQAYIASKGTDLNYVKDTFLDFCKNQTLKNALMKSVDLLELGDYDDIRNLIDRALKAGTERDIGHEYIAELEDRFREEARNTVETPWPLINKLLCGGLGDGDLGMIAGGPGGGKSWALVALGAQAVKTGHTVIHYTLELSEKYVGRRYDACLTELPVGEITQYKDKVKEKIENLRGGLYIREYPAGQIRQMVGALSGAPIRSYGEERSGSVGTPVAGPSTFGQVAGALTAITSDIRLKDDIKLVGKSPSGIKIYNFKYKGDDKKYQGVMAHQVPHASIVNDEGYLMVDYNKLDVEFKEI